MAQSGQTVEALIKSAFALQVAVRSTEGAEAICKKNRLCLTELLRPFCQLNTQVQLKDMQGHLYTARNVRVLFSEPNTEPIPDSKQRILLNNAVQNTVARGDGKPAATVKIGEVVTLASTPWFDQYRDACLEHIRQSDHECIRHYVSVVLVVSSIHPAPLEAFSQLYTRQKESERSKYPKWLTPHLLYYYVLLHDVSEGNDARAQDNFEKVKGTYGAASCYLLQLNSRQPGTRTEDIPDLWSQVIHSPTADNDEVDSPFNFRQKLGNKLLKRDKHKKQEPQRQEPQIPNNEETPEIIKPNDAREEAQLFESGSNESLNQEPSEVTPGNDPLSQLASENPPKSAVISLLDPVEGSVERQKGGRSSVLAGLCLSLEDHNRLRAFVQEFVGQRLLPHLEAVLKNLNEWVVSRRSVRRSLSTMGSRFLKMLGAGNQLNSTVSEEPNYAYNSLELQTRQLADLAFLLQNYDLAFQTYHSIKKDFQGASAWMYYAGSVEMCALSAYLLSSTRREVVSYLEDTISVYNVTCKSVHFGLRASFLLGEILKERGHYRELTQLFIKMTSEDADLRSAVCLEQAAHSFLRVQPSMVRKYALHLILAGHRYARSVQKEHSTRVYKQALEVYRGHGWTLAEDYIHFSLARLTFSLHCTLDAKDAFESLLSHESAQTPTQQLLNLKEFIFVYKQLLNSRNSSVGEQIHLEQQKTTRTCADKVKNVPTLPLPFVHPQLTRVTFATSVAPESLEQPAHLGNESPGRHRAASNSSSKDSNILEEEGEILKRSRSNSGVTIAQHLRRLQQSGDSSSHIIIGASDYDPSRSKVSREEWVLLERNAASGLQGVARENFRPSLLVMDHTTDNSHTPFCVINEQISVGLMLKNPLRVPLLLRQLSLVWQFREHSNETDSSPGASSEVLERVVLQPEEQRMVTLHITPLREGDLKVLGFIYNLCVDTLQQKGSDSPLQPSSCPNLPSMTVSSRDSLYQRHQGLGVQTILSEGVQGRVNISIRGPRLNSTKMEKVSVTYGHDYRLHWVVTPPMPKLVVCMSGLPSWLLAGEVCRVNVEVFNCGQVALNSLRLASSLSQHLLLEEKSNTEHPIYPSTIIATTPTSPSLPSSHPHTYTPSHLHSRSPCIEFPLPHGRLEPGEGVGASLILQGEGGGFFEEEPWNLVFYYEPALITANSRISHRVLRHSCTLRVRESLHVKASAVHGQLPAGEGGGGRGGRGGAMSGGFDVNQLIITVEMENRCQILDSSAVELRVLQLSCVSRRWTVSKLDQEQGLLCLLPSESGVTHLKASRVSQDQLCFSDVPLGQTVISSSRFPTSELFFGSDAYRALQLKEEQKEEEGEKEGKVPAEEIALIVIWQALIPSGSDTLFSYGHKTVNVPLPQSMAALAEPRSSHPPSPYDLVKYHLSHPVSYHHDFTTVSPCRIRVQITLQNCCHSQVHTILELLHPREGHPDVKSSKHPQQESTFIWSGGTCRRHLALEADTTKTVTAYASFSRPGVYNLNSLRVLVKLEGGSSYQLQRWQRTSYITVE